MKRVNKPKNKDVTAHFQMSKKTAPKFICDQTAWQWQQQNATFIDAYNKIVETEGVALQEWRTF